MREGRRKEKKWAPLKGCLWAWWGLASHTLGSREDQSPYRHLGQAALPHERPEEKGKEPLFLC